MPQNGLPGTGRGGRLQMEAPDILNKFKGVNGILNLLALFLGIINIGIIGYNFSYFKGTWRQNLFHSELTFLVIFCACFIGTAINLMGNFVAPQPYATNTIHEMVANATYFILAALGGTVLLIKLTVYGRYFVNSYEVKIFASILGLVESLVYGVNAFILYKNASTLM